MNTAQWQRVKELFAVALDASPGMREEMLAELGAESPELARELAQLLANHDDAGDFIETPIVAELHQEQNLPRPFEPGAEIGPFRIVDTIGVGGMGTVYLAQQGSPVRREVALKVIRASLISPKILARFDSERQALALMNHPNIAQIYHADTTESGLPYFAMEYVPGTHLNQYCDNHRLCLDARLDLFMQACRAFEHAHARGIIHRDIKPSNILVTEQPDGPQIKIIDFGIVKATEHKLTENTLTTRSGLILGTLAYLSPEQAGVTEDPVDCYSDIYSLGLVLYELVTGESPFAVGENMPFHKTLTNIRDMMPKAPGMFYRESGPVQVSAANQRGGTPLSLAAQCEAGLDTVIQRAVAKSPEERYHTIGDLLTDLQYCRQHRKPSPTRREDGVAQEEIPKTSPVHWAGIALILLALLLGFLTWFNLHTHREEGRTLVRMSSEAATLYTESVELNRRSLETAADQRIAMRASLDQLLGQYQTLPVSEQTTVNLGRAYHQLDEDLIALDLLNRHDAPGLERTLLLGLVNAGAFLRAQRMARLQPGDIYLSSMGMRQRLHLGPARSYFEKAHRLGFIQGGYVGALKDYLDDHDERALTVLARLTSIAPTTPGPQLLQGDILAEQGLQWYVRDRGGQAEAMIAEADTHYLAAMRSFPGSAAPPLRRAWLKLAVAGVRGAADEVDDLEVVLSFLDTAVLLAPKAREVHELYAVTHERLAAIVDDPRRTILKERAARHRQKLERQ